MLSDNSFNNNLTLQQEARATLRENFLKAINEFKGVPIKILTYELSTLEAKFAGWKTDGSEVLVKDLETPAKIKMSAAKLRTPDILAIQLEKAVELP